MSRRPIRAAVLVVRIWRDESNETALRARVLENPDVTQVLMNESAAKSVDEICTIVKAWAERFASAADVPGR